MQAGDVVAAAARIRGVAHRTPVLRSASVDAACSAEVYLKAENFQRGGSFKFRGAYNHLAALTPEQRARGVLTTSSGNHAQSVALAGRLLGIRVVVLMPEDAPDTKRAATLAYGATVVGFDRYTQEREALTVGYSAEHDLHVVHAYDHPLTMAGQGTAALELFEEVGDLDALLVCVGGGGLLAGCTTIAKHWAPDCRLIGVEPSGRPALRLALESADASAGAREGDPSRRPADRFDRGALPGASALAALLHGRVPGLHGKRVGVTVSGGNLSAERFAKLVGAAA